jgi:carbon-monoxide dehydrogenase large subunit
MNEVVNPHRTQQHSRPWNGRYEDAALVSGLGKFTADVKDNALAAVFVRSPHAHANIKGIDTSAAKAASGVVAVLTSKDLEPLGLGSVSGSIPFPGRDGKMPYSPHRPALARSKVMHVGEAVALVLAKTDGEAADAADLVEVDYEVLEPVIHLDKAKAAKVTLWPDAPGNLTLDWTSPDDPDGARRKATEAAFNAAKHRVSIEVMNQRICAVSMEPRAALASYDKDTDSYTIHTGTQGTMGVRAQIAMAMNVEMPKVRVLSTDVGGGFGMKASVYAEYPALLAAAKITGSKVQWTSTRTEAFLSDNQARDSRWKVELAFDDDGKFRALKIDGDQNVGAYMTGVAVLIPTIHIAGCMPSVYDIPNVVVDSRCYFSNTVPTGPYRGAGRPEANHLLERVIDAAAIKLGMDSAEIRLRNLIKPSQMPYPTTLGPQYDSGDFPTIFDQAMKAADYAGFASRKAGSEKKGLKRGIGICGFLEISGGHYHEPARLLFKNGKIECGIGPVPQGQGHITVFKQMVAKRLGISDDQVEVQFGDSSKDVAGFGAVASRTAMLTGSAVAIAVDKMLEKAYGVAQTLLQAGEGEVAYHDGVFERKATGQTISLFEVAERATEMARQGAIAESLDTHSEADTGPSFPNGCHIAEVEVDPGTGEAQVVAYTAVGDVGIVLNEKIVDGQVQGGVASGIGQAIGEYTRYDNDSGQLVAASFMDYQMPRASDVPMMTVIHHPVPCKTNYVGAKGTGEAGTTAAPPVIVAAIENAISPDKFLNLQMPVTPLKIWQAMQAK